MTISEAIDHHPPISPHVHSWVVTVGYIMGGGSFLHFISADAENEEKEIELINLTKFSKMMKSPARGLVGNNF